MQRRSFLTKLAGLLPATWAARLLPAAPAARMHQVRIVRDTTFPAAAAIIGYAITAVTVDGKRNMVEWRGHLDASQLKEVEPGQIITAAPGVVFSEPVKIETVHTWIQQPFRPPITVAAHPVKAVDAIFVQRAEGWGVSSGYRKA